MIKEKEQYEQKINDKENEIKKLKTILIIRKKNWIENLKKIKN